jgi:P2 family phage contractile tail tube protein
MPIPKLQKAYNVFIDGRHYAGKAECEPPTLSITTEDYAAGGMSGVAKVDMGRFEPIDLKFSLYEYNRDVITQWGLIDGRAVQVTLRAAQVDDENETTEAVVIEAEGQVHEFAPGGWESASKDASKTEFTMNCRKYKLSVAGATLIEVDVELMTRIIDGTDQMQDLRAAIGF